MYHTNCVFLFNLFAGCGDSKSEDIGKIFSLNSFSLLFICTLYLIVKCNSILKENLCASFSYVLWMVSDVGYMSHIIIYIWFTSGFVMIQLS